MRGQPDAAQDVNKHWIGEVQPIGVVVTAGALAEQALVPGQQSRLDSEAVRELLRGDDEGAPALRDPWSFFSEILDWRPSQVAGSPNGPDIPDALRIVLPASETVLEPQLAVMTPDKAGWQILVRCEAPGVEPDVRGSLPGWEATPHQRLERLLRDTGVPTGILLTDDALRLVHAPANGESSGWFSVPLRALGTTAGRTMLGALKLLLDRIRLFNDAESRRLPALLMASRRAQASVSATLATQVLGALHDLLRGLHAAAPDAAAVLARQRPEHLYEGLLAVLMRLVFLLYAEDRGLIPSRDDPASRTFYEANYGVRGLHARLGQDAALHPDTMDERRGAWHQLLVLFRLVHTGDGSGWMRGRGGKLFDPASFPFLQGQDAAGDPVRVPLVSDGCVLRILDGLLLLKGERLSYRALDVEQIGSVYETVMGFTAEPAAAASIAIEAGKRNRTPVFVDLPALLAQPGKERGTWLKQTTERGKFPPKVEKALAAAKDEVALATALGEVFDKRGSPDARVWPAGTPLLQPTDERRRTGSHYTPRDLTGPIVRHALEPAFTRIGSAAMPEDVLSLKVCDPAMGSGAFLVEACRQLGARLVESWRVHEDLRPVLPPDEDEELHARRLVAQRCLYGVDRNPMAVDLARLSLWLATLARDHEFTFLDHALRTGDSLVGLTPMQIGSFRWQDGQADVAPFNDFVRERVQQALEAREAIRGAPDDVEQEVQQQRFRHVEALAKQARLLGDATLAAFFGSDKPRARETARRELGVAASQPPERAWARVEAIATVLTTGQSALRPFHWELEFPEVFDGSHNGFDAIVGNPPFLGVTSLGAINAGTYADFLRGYFPYSGGKSDLVAYFFRRSFSLLREGGCLGLVATKTVAQGDTRRSGLQQLVIAGARIVRVGERFKWPGDAQVTVLTVHCDRGGQRRILFEGRVVSNISSYLSADHVEDDPLPIKANSGMGFHGAVIQDNPFIVQENIHGLEPDALAPVIGAQEIFAFPEPRIIKHVIDLRKIASDQVEKVFPKAVGLIRKRLGIADNVPLSSKHTNWLRPAKALFQAIEKFSHVIVIPASAVTNFSFTMIENKYIYTHKLIVFGFDDLWKFAVMHSRVHEIWVVAHSSTFGQSNDITYNPTQVFETFPFPLPSEQQITNLASLTTQLVEIRNRACKYFVKGITWVMGQVHREGVDNPVVQDLRQCLQNIDEAVLQAYQWSDLVSMAQPEFTLDNDEEDRYYESRLTWSSTLRAKILARLRLLNVEQAGVNSLSTAASTAKAIGGRINHNGS